MLPGLSQIDVNSNDFQGRPEAYIGGGRAPEMALKWRHSQKPFDLRTLSVGAQVVDVLNRDRFRMCPLRHNILYRGQKRSSLMWCLHAAIEQIRSGNRRVPIIVLGTRELAVMIEGGGINP